LPCSTSKKESAKHVSILLVDDSVVVELKACECIAPIRVAQTLSY
jgi:hypothetical protein